MRPPGAKFRSPVIICRPAWYDTARFTAGRVSYRRPSNAFVEFPMQTLEPAVAPDLSAWIGNADAFPILRTWDFYNHAGVAPLSHAAAEAMRALATQAEQFSYLEQAAGTRTLRSCRRAAARLINAESREIAFVKNTSEGIATVANGIDWHEGDRIVTTAVEYPANIYPWMDVAKRLWRGIGDGAGGDFPGRRSPRTAAESVGRRG